MRIGPRVLLAFSAALVVVGGCSDGHSSSSSVRSSSTPSVDPCTLLTPPEIASALGQPFDHSGRGYRAVGDLVCSWAGTDSTVTLALATDASLLSDQQGSVTDWFRNVTADQVTEPAPNAVVNALFTPSSLAILLPHEAFIIGPDLVTNGAASPEVRHALVKLADLVIARLPP